MIVGYAESLLDPTCRIEPPHNYCHHSNGNGDALEDVGPNYSLESSLTFRITYD
jgi:hypothetical protein